MDGGQMHGRPYRRNLVLNLHWSCLVLSFILTLFSHTLFVPRHSVRMSLAFIISAIAVVIVANFRDLWLSGTSFVCLSEQFLGIPGCSSYGSFWQSQWKRSSVMVIGSLITWVLTFWIPKSLSSLFIRPSTLILAACQIAGIVCRIHLSFDHA